MRRTKSILAKLGVTLLLAGAVVTAFREGLVPAKYSPLPVISLNEPGHWLLDWQLAGLRREPELCWRVLKPPYLDAVLVADSPMKDGCGWQNSVRMSLSSGARISVDKISCELAAAFALWMAYEIQPLAMAMLGQRVASVQHMGSYACRNILGSAALKGFRSEHARANAIDIAGFTLADGRQISVLRHWSNTGREGLFIRTAHERACRYFRVAIGPGFNAAHKDHFHLDRGFISACR